MFSAELKKLLIQVITSWQVIVVTVVLVFYIFIVNSVARLYRRRRYSKPKLMPDVSQTPAEVSTETDELGLEEESE